MTIELRPLHGDFGIEILNVDISAGLGNAQFAEIEQAVEDYSVVLIKHQNLDDDLQRAFGNRFGELEFDHVTYGRDRRVNYVYRIGNIDRDGNHMPASHERVVFSTGNQMWHTDSSFRPAPAKFSISYAYEVTPQGGELEFVSARAAYARLPESLQSTINDLVVTHDYVFSRSKVSPDAVTPSHAESLPPVPQRLVRTNPVNGKKNYYVGSHARSIEGWSDSEARVLLDDLLDRAIQPECIYSHRWETQDLLIWDNRCVLHHGRPFDADRYRRRMHQIRVTCGCSSMDE